MNNSRHKILKGSVIYLIVALFLLYEMADQVTPSIIMPQLMKDLHINAAVIGWISGIYFYSYTAMQIPVGLFYDRYSYRSLLLIAIAVCTLGCVLFAYSHSLMLVLIARFLLGIGSAFAFVGVLMVANDWFKVQYFALLVGIGQFLAAVGSLGGELPLSLLVNHLGWQGAVKILAIAGLMLWILVYFFVHTYKHSCPQPLTGEKPKSSWSSLQKIVRSPKLIAIAGYAFSAWAPIAVFASMWGIPFFMRRYHIDNTHAAMIVAFVWIGLAVASPILGYIKQWISIRTLLIICSCIGIVASLNLIYLSHLTMVWSYFFAACIGVAAGGQILTFDLVRKHMNNTDLAAASGFNNMAVVAGGALLQPLVGELLQIFWQGKMLNGIPIYGLASYHSAFVIIPLSFTLGLVIALTKI